MDFVSFYIIMMFKVKYLQHLVFRFKNINLLYVYVLYSSNTVLGAAESAKLLIYCY